MYELAKDTLFFDGQCPLCSKEIRWLKKLARPSLQLVDIHANVPEKCETSSKRQGESIILPDRQDLLKTLHLRKADGQWLTGINANVAAWAHTPMGIVFKILKLPVIKGLAGRFYNYWAKVRYQRLYCQVDNNGKPTRCS